MKCLFTILRCSKFLQNVEYANQIILNRAHLIKLNKFDTYFCSKNYGSFIKHKEQQHSLQQDLGTTTHDLLNNKINKLNTVEISKLMDRLLKENRLDAAKECYERLRANQAFPEKNVFRYYLMRLACAGDIETIAAIESRLDPELRKNLSYANFQCDAYIAANKTKTYLEKLIDDIRTAQTRDEVNKIHNELPRRGLLTILENKPELHLLMCSLAQEYANKRKLGPINIFWQYYIILGDEQSAKFLWGKYLRKARVIFVRDIIRAAEEKQDAKIVQLAAAQMRTNPNISKGFVQSLESCLDKIEKINRSKNTAKESAKANLREAQKPGDVTEQLKRKLGNEAFKTTDLNHLF